MLELKFPNRFLMQPLENGDCTVLDFVMALVLGIIGIVLVHTLCQALNILNTILINSL